MPVDPVDAVDDVGLAEGGTDERDEHVRGVTEEDDVHRAADAHLGDRLREIARKRRDRAGRAVHAQHPASRAVRHVERTVGTDRTARAAATGASGRGERGELALDGLVGPRRGRDADRHQRGRHRRDQRSGAHGRASSTRLKGVSAARRKRVKPASVTTSEILAGPAWAPSASPTS